MADAMEKYKGQTIKQAQYLLNYMGFDVYDGNVPDGKFGVKTSSAIIIIQWAAGIEMTGKVDDGRTIAALRGLVSKGVTREIIMNMAWSPEPSGAVWVPKKTLVSSFGDYENGKMGTSKMTYLPSGAGSNGKPGTYLLPVVAVAWARMDPTTGTGTTPRR